MKRTTPAPALTDGSRGNWSGVELIKGIGAGICAACIPAGVLTGSGKGDVLMFFGLGGVGAAMTWVDEFSTFDVEFSSGTMMVDAVTGSVVCLGRGCPCA